ncbi:MAG: helix-turn-helix transcriptional regulator [Nitrospirae bacterium]|nr:helix-turn-helix transcriptional regulator [Nitrospirota bacterium]
MDREILELHASICQIMANAKRLEIISILGDKELTVGEIAEMMDIKMANLSQHLSIMKAKGILKSRREGVNIHYRISNPKVVQACRLMREVMIEQLREKGMLSKVVSKGK